jgi:GNAT superfamily N-acetyltransferase
MPNIRHCRPDERNTILSIINAAAERYRAAIPADCWHEPYMSMPELEREIGNGVRFWGVDDDAGRLVGVMGIQPVKDVTLVRHAYVRPEHQGRGIGGLLLRQLETLTHTRILIGTWADATWAIRFYQRHGYALIPREETPALLERYWNIPQRQVETSVVLAKDPREERGASNSPPPHRTIQYRIPGTSATPSDSPT